VVTTTIVHLSTAVKEHAMRRLSVLILSLTLVALHVTFVPTHVAGQDATPRPRPAHEERGVPAEECRVQPRSVDEVFALLGLAEGAGQASPAPRTPVPAPPWTAADEETAAAAETTAREWLACINADDNPRIAALMTDAALTRFFATRLTDAAAIAAARANLAGTPAPRAEEERARLVAVSDVSRLDDGRIAALAVINEPTLRPHGQETLLLIFAPVGNRLLLDDVIQFSIVPPRSGTPVAGTPQP
jgi:hypothetical protein